MAGHSLTIAIAHLLSDRRLRLEFSQDRLRVAAALDLPPADRDLLIAIDVASLNQQADALVAKRRAEVARIIPETWTRLGPEARACFDDFAVTCWPSGHLRHPHDALAFLEHLTSRNLPCDRIEKLRLETRLSNARRRIAVTAKAGRWRLPALYVAWRRADAWHERLFHLGPPSRAQKVKVRYRRSRYP